jgi:hypothetical protein
MATRRLPSRRRQFTTRLGAAGLALAAAQAQAATDNWTCASGDWWRSHACWSLGHAPGHGDDVALPPTVTMAEITWADPLLPDVVLGTLSLTSVPGRGSTFPSLLQAGPGTLASAVEIVGSLGSAWHRQSGGANRTGQLVLGTGNEAYHGSYELSGADTRLEVAGSIDMGSLRSNGTFQQRGGTVTAGRLSQAAGSGHATSYDLSAGVLSTESTVIGSADRPGDNVFTQTGGSHQTGWLALGPTGAAYRLQGGELRTGQITGASAASFQWTGGSLHLASAQRIGDGSFFLESNGSFAVGSGRTFGADMLGVMAGGTLAHAGGTVRVEAGNGFANLGTHDIGNGRFTVEGQAQNLGLALLAGGRIDGAGFYTNQGVLRGHGSIAGHQNFSNAGVLQVSGGALSFDQFNITAVNTGTMSFAALTDGLTLAPLGLVGRVATLSNQGSFTLSGQQINGAGMFVNALGGVMSGWGTVRSGFANEGTLNVEGGSLTVSAPFDNMGLLQLSGAAARLAGGRITNWTTLQGNGTVVSDIVNTGVIEARGGTLALTTTQFVNQGTLAATGGNMLYFAADGLTRNEGLVSLNGGTLDNGFGDVDNIGVIAGHGQMRAGHIRNSGQLQLSGGASRLQARFTNLAGGLAIVSGHADATFADTAEFQSGSELRVSEGAVATFFGLVIERDGARFTGTGSKHFEGGLSVGASPGLAHESGSVSFGGGNIYLAELAGLAGGTQFDRYIVDGLLAFGGTLQLKELGAFQAQAGDRFDLFDWGSTTGRFTGIDLSQAVLGEGLRWDVSQLYTTGTISVVVVPEPASAALMLAGVAALLLHARRRP